jgi:hypothetical protein
MKIDQQELYKLYMRRVDFITEECDWVTSFGPEEIVGMISNILENNPNLIQTTPTISDDFQIGPDGAFEYQEALRMEEIANEQFKNVGDEGLFPNHTDKDIWVNGFVSAFEWIMANYYAPIKKK